MAWWDHEDLKSPSDKSDKYKITFTSDYTKEEVEEATIRYNEKNKEIEENILNTHNDFGFTTEPDEIENNEDTKARKMYDLILPLLKNLKKNPENKIIKWPDREQKINIFIDKLNKILDN